MENNKSNGITYYPFAPRVSFEQAQTMVYSMRESEFPLHRDVWYRAYVQRKLDLAERLDTRRELMPGVYMREYCDASLPVITRNGLANIEIPCGLTSDDCIWSGKPRVGFECLTVSAAERDRLLEYLYSWVVKTPLDAATREWLNGSKAAELIERCRDEITAFLDALEKARDVTEPRLLERECRKALNRLFALRSYRSRGMDVPFNTAFISSFAALIDGMEEAGYFPCAQLDGEGILSCLDDGADLEKFIYMLYEGQFGKAARAPLMYALLSDVLPGSERSVIYTEALTRAVERLRELLSGDGGLDVRKWAENTALTFNIVLMSGRWFSIRPE